MSVRKIVLPAVLVLAATGQASAQLNIKSLTNGDLDPFKKGNKTGVTIQTPLVKPNVRVPGQTPPTPSYLSNSGNQTAPAQGRPPQRPPQTNQTQTQQQQQLAQQKLLQQQNATYQAQLKAAQQNQQAAQAQLQAAQTQQQVYQQQLKNAQAQNQILQQQNSQLQNTQNQKLEQQAQLINGIGGLVGAVANGLQQQPQYQPTQLTQPYPPQYQPQQPYQPDPSQYQPQYQPQQPQYQPQYQPQQPQYQPQQPTPYGAVPRSAVRTQPAQVPQPATYGAPRQAVRPR